MYKVQQKGMALRELHFKIMQDFFPKVLHKLCSVFI